MSAAKAAKSGLKLPLKCCRFPCLLGHCGMTLCTLVHEIWPCLSQRNGLKNRTSVTPTILAHDKSGYSGVSVSGVSTNRCQAAVSCQSPDEATHCVSCVRNAILAPIGLDLSEMRKTSNVSDVQNRKKNINAIAFTVYKHINSI